MRKSCSISRPDGLLHLPGAPMADGNECITFFHSSVIEFLLRVKWKSRFDQDTSMGLLSHGKLVLAERCVIEAAIPPLVLYRRYSLNWSRQVRNCPHEAADAQLDR